MPTIQTARIFVQARMSSEFPQRVLALFRGKPLIDHVMSAGMEVDDTVLVTRIGHDDPLAMHRRAAGRSRGIWIMFSNCFESLAFTLQMIVLGRDSPDSVM